MENISRLLMMGFSVFIFAAALMTVIIMYHGISDFRNTLENRQSYRSIMEGD